MKGFSIALALGLTFAAYCGFAYVSPPVDDELYYWCWAKDLQFSYYDHPPMCALMIRASVELLGDNLFAIRFPACISTTIILGCLTYLTRPKWILFFVFVSPMFTFGAVILTPDTPLLLFWMLYLVWLVSVHRKLDSSLPIPLWQWIFGGVLLGCGILGKYTTGLAIPAGTLSFLWLGRTEWKKWIPGYALHLIAGFVTSMPILIYNIQRNFEPLLYQWRHSMSDDEPGIVPFGEFVGVQVLLVGTMPILLFPWVVAKYRTFLSDSRFRVCFCLFAFPFAFFLFKSSRGALQGNWAMACYLGFWPLAGYWYDTVAKAGWWRYLTHLTFGIPAACVLLLAIHLAYPLPFVRIDDDRVHYMKARNEYAKGIAEEIRQRRGNEPVFVTDYQWVAFLRFYGVDAHQIEGITRPSHFTQVPEYVNDYPKALYFSDYELPVASREGLEEPKKLDDYVFWMRGQRLTHYSLWEYQRRDGWVKAPISGASPGGGSLLSIPTDSPKR